MRYPHIHLPEELLAPEPAAKSMHLLESRLEGEVMAGMLHAHLHQHFHNPDLVHAELLWRFPLPPGAVLLDCAVRFADTLLKAEIQARQHAEALYEEAIATGDAACLLQRMPDGSLLLQIGNLAADEHCHIDLRFACLLQQQQDHLRLNFPTTIAPVFEAYGHASAMPPYVPAASSLTRLPFSLRLKLYAQWALARISSPSHALATRQLAGGMGPCLELEISGPALLDRDVVLKLEGLPLQTFGLIQPEQTATGRYAAWASMIPMLDSPPISEAVSLGILVDCSGSMNGDSIQAARLALQDVVQTLGPTDRFMLARFGTGFEAERERLHDAQAEQCNSARRWIDQLKANMGGTELYLALRRLRALEPELRDVLLLTDGGVSESDPILAQLAKAGVRIFVVGIGSTPEHGLLRQLAAQTGGACELIAVSEQVSAAMLRMMQRIRQPRLSQPQLLGVHAQPDDWHSELPAYLYAGDPVSIALQAGTQPAALQLTALYQGQRITVAQLTHWQAAEQPEHGLPRLVAAQRIAQLEFQHQPASMISAIALQYQLQSQHTDWVLRHMRAEGVQGDGAPELILISPMLAAGWGGHGSVQGEIPAVMRRASSGVVAEADTARYPYQLTPLAAQQALLDMAQRKWPATRDGLLSMGLPSALLDWLSTLHLRYSTLPEADLFQHFLRLLALQRLCASDATVPIRLTSRQSWQQNRLRRRQTTQSTLPAALTLDLQAMLDDCSSERWPSHVVPDSTDIPSFLQDWATTPRQTFWQRLVQRLARFVD